MTDIYLLEIEEAGRGEHVQGEAFQTVVAHVEHLGPGVHVGRDGGGPRAPALHRHLARLPETSTRGGAEGGAQGGGEETHQGQEEEHGHDNL